MKSKIWAVSQNARFHIVPMSKQTLPNALNIMKNHFFKEELVSKCCGVSTNPKSIEELVKLAELAAKDGVSLVAVEKATGVVAGTIFNKILVKDNSEENFFQNYYKNCKQESSKALIKFIIDADSKINVFQHHNTNCALKPMFGSTKPDYRLNSLAFLLMKVSVELGKALLKGENVKNGIDNNDLSLEPVPTVAYTLLTTFKTQRAARKLGFSILDEVNYDECFYGGKSFASKIECGTKSCTIASLKLN